MGDSAKSNRFKSFSMRALFVSIAVAAVGFSFLAFTVQRGHRQTLAIDRIRELGGIPQITDSTGLVLNEGDTAGPAWLRSLFGDGVYYRVPLVQLGNRSITATELRAMIPHLQNLLPQGQHVYLDVSGNANVDASLLSEMRSALQNCKVVEYTPVPDRAENLVQEGMRKENVVTAIGSAMYGQRDDWVGDREQTIEMLGALNRRYTDSIGREWWVYYTDDVGIGEFRVEFDSDGTVAATSMGPGPQVQLENTNKNHRKNMTAEGGKRNRYALTTVLSKPSHHRQEETKYEAGEGKVD